MKLVAAALLSIGTLTPAQPSPYDPLAYGREKADKVVNLEATVPPACYTKTAGVSNPCWVCHTGGMAPNTIVDHDLQRDYAFSEFALENHWANLFTPTATVPGQVEDDEILRYVRQENVSALTAALRARTDYRGYIPDLDFQKGFRPDGFAEDGSGWRALRYKPFPGTFWPTNGSTDDVMVRLPAVFQRLDGVPHPGVYRLNLALLEAAMTQDAREPGQPREVEPVDETLAGVDLDGDGRLGTATRIVRLPAYYVGDAHTIPLLPRLHPEGTEYLHSVRYLDPDAPDHIGARMKELRYSRKVRALDDWGILATIEEEYEAKDRGRTPSFPGSGEVGLRNGFGWQLQGFIEDAEGRLRAQTTEETFTCMGCHGPIGVTVDQTFTLPRKLPGSAGWRPQGLTGQKDVPQAGHSEPEVLTYLKRVRGGDEFRANREMVDRFFDGDRLREEEVARAAPGGDRDLAWLLFPTRERAVALNRAYRALVRTQRFDLGRDAVLSPPENVHLRIENGSTDLGKTGLVFIDGRLQLDWQWRSPAQTK